MSKHCTTLMVAVGLALVLGDSARAEDGVGKSMTAKTTAGGSHVLKDPGALFAREPAF